jgi:NitT/TauT family transport system substrate-binding protein
MAVKLTGAGKMIIFLIIVGLVGLFVYLKKDTLFTKPEPKENISSDDFGDLTKAPNGSPQVPSSAVLEPSAGPLGSGKLDRPLKVAINTWAGHTPIIMANNGMEPNEDCIFFKNYGIKVELILIDEPGQKKNALQSGDVDIIWNTVDMWASEASILWEKAKMRPKAIIQQDWSRGGDGMVATRDITSIEQLAGKKISTTQYTPSHFFLLYILAQSNLTSAEILDIRKNLVIMPDAKKAAQAFITGDVQAAVTWEPDLSDAADQGNGHKLATTVVATNVISDVMVASPIVIDQGPQTVIAFVRGMLDAFEVIENEKNRTYITVGQALSVPPEEVEGMLSGLKLTNYADNRRFFGLDDGPNQFDALFTAASTIWRKEGVISQPVSPHQARDSRFMEAIAAHYPSAPAEQEFTFTAPAADAVPLLTKTTSIHFASGRADLDANGRFILDQFADTLISFGNAYIKIEGNTDNVGSRQANIVLSQRRAASVRDYMVSKYNFDRNRFVVVGNGPDQPVADNNSDEGREKNRRTEFRIIPNE